jgi:anti-sigma regulatory factor (Ser/Thr protein kinase)
MASSLESLRDLVERKGEVANRDVVGALGVSSATSHRLLRAAVDGGMLESHGRGRAARYRLRRIRHRYRLAGLAEDRVWKRLSDEIEKVCPLTDERANLQYAATEVINNAIEHSRGRSLEVTVAFETSTTIVTVRDDGVGVFRRLCEDFGFPSAHEAIVQLEKGKLTSDPSQHSGEGLFFSSKAVTRFRLESQGVAWIVDNQVGDSAVGPSEIRRGTQVVSAVVRGHTPRLEEVFRAYTDPETLRFTRTRTTIRLGALGSSLVSRSEARRATARLTDFREAVLDFSGVETVGQGFCDEIFRVFARRHPEVKLEPVGMNEPVAFMVARARAT